MLVTNLLQCLVTWSIRKEFIGLMSHVYGPALPPGFQRNPDKDSIVTSSDSNASCQDNQPSCSVYSSTSEGADCLNWTTGPSPKDAEVSSSWPYKRGSCQVSSISSQSEQDGSIMVGPLLPATHKSHQSTCNVEVSSSTCLTEDKIIGPQLPKSNDDEMKTPESASSDTVNCESYLGPNQSSTSSPGTCAGSDVYGPALPPDLIKIKSKDDSSEREKLSSTAEDFSLIGPLPSEMFQQGMKDATLAHDIEKRALNMKDKLTNKADEVVSRETWMLELPPEVGPGLGLVARTFKQSKSTNQSKDRSVWTDTPADQAKKQKDSEGKHGKRNFKDTENFTSERDQQCAKIVEDYNKTKRSESLLDLHTKQRKLDKKNDEEPVQRRPFSREYDLGAVELNSAQRKSIIDQSQSLSSRFGSGKSRFL
ncbi:GPALPP motifs-containing protein 1-like [Argonauta hians]